jgi:transketolase
MTSLNAKELTDKANEIRLISLEMVDKAGGGHVGGSLSAMDILTALYFSILNIDPANPKMEGRDRFILSAGHKAAGYVPVLAARGFFDLQLLDTFNKLDSPFGMHPDMHKIPGCDFSTGSLGHGLPVAVGMAMALRMDKSSARVFVLMGDGETHEGTVWEAAAGASHHHLQNLIAIVDYNKCTMDGPIETVMSLEPIEERWKSFGWAVRRIDGHNMEAILRSLSSLPEQKGKPTVIIADTIKGKGLPSIEGNYHWHYGVLSENQLSEARVALGGGK